MLALLNTEVNRKYFGQLGFLHIMLGSAHTIGKKPQTPALQTETRRVKIIFCSIIFIQGELVEKEITPWHLPGVKKLKMQPNKNLLIKEPVG